MKTGTKKPAVIKATTTEKKSVKETVKTNAINTELSKIEAAYKQAINGKIKFSEVKEMFKKLHREVKKSSKTKYF